MEKDIWVKVVVTVDHNTYKAGSVFTVKLPTYGLIERKKFYSVLEGESNGLYLRQNKCCPLHNLAKLMFIGEN